MTFRDEAPGDGQAPTQGRPEDIVDAIKRHEEAGVDYFVFDLVPETLQETLDTMERFAQEVRPKLEG